MATTARSHVRHQTVNRQLGSALGILFFAVALSAGLPDPAGASSTGSTDIRSTTIEFFEPYTAFGLRPGVDVDKTATGYCWTSSDPVANPDAWRCFEGQEILDPCFSSPYVAHPTSVVCGTPWSGVVDLKLTKPLPLAQAHTNVYPSVGWLLELANGVRCTEIEGASGTTAGVPLAYSCNGSASAGELRWSTEPWTVPFVSKGATKAVTEAVSVAWGG